MLCIYMYLFVNQQYLNPGTDVRGEKVSQDILWLSPPNELWYNKFSQSYV